MMGLHQNYPVTWGAERMEGLTLDLGLDGMFSPLPPELNSAGTKDSDPHASWRYFGHSQTQQHIVVHNLDDDEDDNNDPCALLRSSSNNGREDEQKPDMFELSLSCPPQTPRRQPQPQQQQQQLINMKLERESIEPPSLNMVMPSLPEEDSVSQSKGSFNCWGQTTELPPGKELHLYGDVGDENSGEFLDDDTIADFQDFKPDRCGFLGSGIQPAAAAKQYPETIILTDSDDDSDDDYLFEERYPSLEDGSILPLSCGGSGSRRGSQERGIAAISQSLPLRQIKQHVRSSRCDEDYNSSVTPSPSHLPDITTSRPQIGPRTPDDSAPPFEHGNQSNPKRLRGHGDHDSLPSDSLDGSPSDRQNEAKRARGNIGEDGLQAAYTAQSTGNSVQVPIQTPLLDVNQAIQEMPQDTAEAFKELFRLRLASGSRPSPEVDEMENACSITSDDPPSPPTSTVRQPSHALDEMESRRSVLGDYQQPDSPATVTEASHSGESRRSVSTGEFENINSPTLATVEQPIFAHGCPYESAARSQCSHPIVYEQPAAGKRMSNADVVLYEPKPEPVESWRENNMAGSVVHVKQEQMHYQPIPDRATIWPVGESAVGPRYSNRNLIETALNTFEQVRQQIIRDPSYGQPFLDAQAPSRKGSKSNSRRLRADLKAACLMRKRNYWLNADVRPIGEVPGVAVGDVFRYRIEMAVIGLHRAVQAGIAVVPLEYSPYGHTVASSVVIGVSDPYQDDNDMGDTVVYSGQGGLCGRTKESQDQKLQRGNLAMSNSYHLKLPVRLIRGHKEQKSMTGIMYSYDGLYQIVDMNYVVGVNGKKVYKFTMHRLPGQAPILSGYPAPLGSQPPAREPTHHNAVHWSEAPDTKPLYLEKHAVA